MSSISNSDLRRYRHQRKLSLNELADEIGVSPPVIHHLEHRHGHRTVRQILKYCREHGLDPALFYPCD